RPLRRLQQPIDGCLAAALGVALDVVVKESARAAYIVAEFLAPDDAAYLSLDIAGARLEEKLEDLPDTSNDVVCMGRVIDEYPVPIDTHRVLVIRDQKAPKFRCWWHVAPCPTCKQPLAARDPVRARGKPIRSHQHAGRAHWKR